MTGALLPFCVVAGSPGFASHGGGLIQELAASSGSSWMSEALNLHLAILLLIRERERGGGGEREMNRMRVTQKYGTQSVRASVHQDM